MEVYDIWSEYHNLVGISDLHKALKLNVRIVNLIKLRLLFN